LPVAVDPPLFLAPLVVRFPFPPAAPFCREISDCPPLFPRAPSDAHSTTHHSRNAFDWNFNLPFFPNVNARPTHFFFVAPCCYSFAFFPATGCFPHTESSLSRSSNLFIVVSDYRPHFGCRCRRLCRFTQSRRGPGKTSRFPLAFSLFFSFCFFLVRMLCVPQFLSVFFFFFLHTHPFFSKHRFFCELGFRSQNPLSGVSVRAIEMFHFFSPPPPARTTCSYASCLFCLLRWHL